MTSRAVALADDEIHVWCADPDDLARRADASALRRLLSPDERARLGSHRFEADRKSYLAAHVLVRTVLSRYEPVAPAAWRFACNAHGRPEIAGRATTLRFNLSHTDGLVVCAVAREAELGVDVEDAERRAPLELAERWFAAVEVAALRALSPEARPRRFFEYWTLKESYVKARGIGLALALDRFAFVLDGGGAPRLELDAAVGDDAASWQLAQRWATRRHLVAICARRRDRRDRQILLRWQRAA